MLPMQSIDHAVAEMRFARREPRFRGGFIRPNPYNDRELYDPVYDPLWSAAEDLDFSIGIHERLHEHDLGRSVRASPEDYRKSKDRTDTAGDAFGALLTLCVISGGLGSLITLALFAAPRLVRRRATPRERERKPIPQPAKWLVGRSGCHGTATNTPLRKSRPFRVSLPGRRWRKP